jgi:hypothetical protein
MYFVFINENRRMKLVKTVLRRGRRRENNVGDKSKTYCKYICSYHKYLLFKYFKKFFMHLFTFAYIVWAISPSCPLSPSFLPASSLPGRACSDLLSNFVEEKT